MGLLIGVPTGVGVGRMVWMAVDRALGLPPNAVIPVFVLALVVPVALAAANAVAAVRGILAGRARPAIILRTE